MRPNTRQQDTKLERAVAAVMRPATVMRPARAVAVAVLALMPLACGADGDRPGWTIFPDMMKSVPYDTYGPSPVTENGATLMRPPDGTIPVNGEPFLFGASEREAIRAGEQLHSPLDMTAENLAAGARLYASFCQVCHGPGGQGDGPIIGPGRFPNPPSLLSQHARDYPDGRIYHVITWGQGIMPRHNFQVRPQDRWRIVQYVRTLQGQPEAAPAAATATDTPTLEDGDRLPSSPTNKGQGR